MKLKFSYLASLLLFSHERTREQCIIILETKGGRALTKHIHTTHTNLESINKQFISEFYYITLFNL